MEQELAVLRAKHKAEEEEVRKRCKEKVEALEEECNAEVEEMKESIRELKVTLSNTEMEEEVMEQTRSELECPVRYCSEYFYQKKTVASLVLNILSPQPNLVSHLQRFASRRCGLQCGSGNAVMDILFVRLVGGSRR